ncbi:hypothetical protein [Tropicibacter naphthalenivorans]|uniref:Uncharacterized protein n=1 Tax=Tropicibacter naphthalenivorans TaxID=441103 RepID=A0A0P1H0H0_9RHOB|nr:hypothetical protein [Tropicibacter naphthalenivorans]CUH79584.1 hypothetical protein TRN7648_02547 [Tropicibacter naphthalenivorans]SMC73623.1 hypothetical protein SAMN04488093_103176 [Tropicibacter naphthalenivorans]
MITQFKAIALITLTTASFQATTAQAADLTTAQVQAQATAMSGCQVEPCPTTHTIPLPKGRVAPLDAQDDISEELDAEETIRWPRWRNGCKRGGFGKVTCPKWK